MTVTIIGDFADPLSFLASQRVEQLRSLGLLEVEWVAVEADRSRPLGGAPVDPALLERVRRLALPAEAVPAPDVRVPSSRAATAAYAESATDGIRDAMRRALFDALWVHRCAIGDPDVIRRLTFDVANPSPVSADLERRLPANSPLVPLGSTDFLSTTRQLGLTVSMSRGPLTTTGQRRVDGWRRFWARRGSRPLPLLITDLGEAVSGERALSWLADRLPHREPVLERPEAAQPPAAVLPRQHARVAAP